MRGGEAMAAKRAAAQGRAAKCRARFARQLQKGGADDRRPVCGREMRPNGSKGRGGNGSRVWEKRKAPAFAGRLRNLPMAHFLSIKKVTKERWGRSVRLKN